MSAALLTSHRTADFRRGKRLGKNDHIVKWDQAGESASLDRQGDLRRGSPEFLLIRGMPSPDSAARLSCQNRHRRHDVVECR